MLTIRTEAFLRDLVAACKKHGCELSGDFAVHVTEESFCSGEGPSSVFGLSAIDGEGAFYHTNEEIE